MADPAQRGEEEPPLEGSLKSSMAWFLGIGVGVLILVALGAAYTIGFNRGKDQAPEGRAEKPVAETPAGAPPSGPGRELFVSNCGSCHTLSAAGTDGTAGPNLDDLAPDEGQVEAAIQNGGTGSGAMPAELLQGTQAQQVAAYVAAAAGG
jgi:mono/diheme cytochrome c family protein